MTLAEDHIQLCLTMCERALFARENGEAVAHAEEALRFDPKSQAALFMAGTALYRLDQPGIALPLLMAAGDLGPSDLTADILNNIGCCLRDRHPADAYEAFRRAHAASPETVEFMVNVASVTGLLGKDEECVSWADKILKVVPDQELAIYNSSLSLLSLGRWEEGWKRYAGSLGNKYRELRNYHANGMTPRWHPKRDQATVVIHGEQGIGDEILFASMLDHVKDRPGKTILEVIPQNKGLFERSFPWATVYGTRGRTHAEWPTKERPDARLEMGALGEFFAPVPFRRGAFLTADPAKRAMVRAWMDAMLPAGALRVGIAWTGGSWATGRKERSLSLHELAPILKAPGCAFVCLEYEDPKELPEGVYDLRSFVRKGVDYDDTAAVVAELDLVIAPTTSVVDLAGALGVPCWALVNYAPQWRYSPRAGERTMWVYESVTTYRQTHPYQWGAPVAKAARELRELTGQRKVAA